MVAIISQYRANGNFIIIKETRTISLKAGISSWSVKFWNREQKNWVTNLDHIEPSTFQIKWVAKKEFETIVKQETHCRVVKKINEKLYECYSGDDLIVRWRLERQKEYHKPDDNHFQKPTAMEFSFR